MMANMDQVIPYGGFVPEIHVTAYVSKLACIIGNVRVGKQSSIFEHVVLKGDFGAVRIGAKVNVQSGTVVHTLEENDCVIHDEVTIGHNAIVHGCTLERGVTIGLGAIVMGRTSIGENTIVGAGSLIPQDKRIPARKLVLGRPARVIRDLRQDEFDEIRRVTNLYVEKGIKYKEAGL
ncbi:gamma carbonic anhydrase family protein [Candidatus Bathyarchaeota archaeon]|nr:gamma carbonic anhydrase family protein [Candidatus Bathyarchaeota archaeon]